MPTALETSLSALLVGTVITINAIAINPDKIMSEAKANVNSANLHQIATVLEIYYMDHNSYPNVSGGEELVNVLNTEGYISNRPLDSSVFVYTPENNAQEYKLSVNK